MYLYIKVWCIGCDDTSFFSNKIFNTNGPFVTVLNCKCLIWFTMWTSHFAVQCIRTDLSYIRLTSIHTLQHALYQRIQNVSKRIQNISKRIQTYQNVFKRIKNVSKRIKTYQKFWFKTYQKRIKKKEPNLTLSTLKCNFNPQTDSSSRCPPLNFDRKAFIFKNFIKMDN